MKKIKRTLCRIADVIFKNIVEPLPPVRMQRLLFFFSMLLLGSSQLSAQTADTLISDYWISPDIPKVTAGSLNRPSLVLRSSTLSRVASTGNPDIAQSLLCQDLKVTFILDESGSINASESEGVRAGARALANALLNSGATLQLVEFDTKSTIINLGGTLVNSSFITNLNAYLGANNGTYTGSGYNGQTYNPRSSGSCIGWTNWQDALEDVATINADLVMFFTDGNPTAYNVTGASCSGVKTGLTGDEPLDPAIIQANLVKGQNKHMFVVGVGDDLNLDNIKAISGNDAFGPAHDILTADYALPPFDQLAANLTAAVNAICGTELLIDKTSSNSGVCAGQTVTFTNTVTNTGGDFNFTALSVVVKDVYPGGYSNLQLLAPVPAGATISGGNTVNIPVGDMLAGQTLTYQVKATVLAPIPAKNYKSLVSATAFNANEVKDSVSVLSGYATASLDTTSCSPVVINGVNYSTTGTFTQTLQSTAGCDSILTINITSGAPSSSTETISLCGDSYVWHDQTFTESNNTATWTDVNAAGCDSIVTLNLTLKKASASTETVSLCGDSYVWHDQTFTESNNTATWTGVNAAGCDSVVTLNLILKKASASTETVSLCGDSYVWHDQTFTESNNTATWTGVNAAGCDSVVTLNLTLKKGSTSTETVAVCGNSYVWHDQTFTESNNTATWTGVNAAGCDSVVTLNLTFKKASASTETVSICGNSYVWHGQTFTASNNTATWTGVNAAGCDSIVTLNLTLKKASASTETIVACNSYTWHGSIYTTSNTTATWTGVNAAGCDSVVTLNLTINKAPSIGALTCPGAVCRNQTGIKLTVAAGTGATSYEWVLPTGVTGSSSSNSIAISIGSSFTTGTIKVRAKNACGYSDYVQCTLTSPTAVPAVPGTIAGPVTACAAGNYTYSIAPVAGATGYTWSVTGTGLSIYSGQGTTSIVVTATTSFTTGSISVKATNCLGSCAAKILSVYASKCPGTPGAISGCATGVCKKGTVVYSIAAVTGAASYVWTVPTGATITGNSTGNSITVTYGTGFTGTGVVTVKAKNACGTSAVAASLNVSAFPAQPGAITGSAAVAKTQTAVVYAVAAVTDATSYTWTITGGAKFVGATNGRSVTVNFTTATSSTAVLTVKANNACGSSTASTKTIAVSGVNVYARQAGNGSNVALEEVNKLPAYTIYPNPGNGKFNISFNTKDADKVSINIMDENGRVFYRSVKTYTAGYQLSQVNMPAVAKGVYYARIWRNGKEEKAIRIFIQ